MPWAVAAAVVTAASTVYTGRKQRKEQRRAQRIENKRRKLEARRQAQSMISEGLIQRADVVQSGANQGVSGASTVLGAAGSIQSQVSGALAFAEQNNQYITAANQRLARAAEWRQLGQDIQAVNQAFQSSQGSTG